MCIQRSTTYSSKTLLRAALAHCLHTFTVLHPPISPVSFSPVSFSLAVCYLRKSWSLTTSYLAPKAVHDLQLVLGADECDLPLLHLLCPNLLLLWAIHDNKARSSAKSRSVTNPPGFLGSLLEGFFFVVWAACVLWGLIWTLKSIGICDQKALKQILELINRFLQFWKLYTIIR